MKKGAPSKTLGIFLGTEAFLRLTHEPACLQAQGYERGNPMVKPCAGPVRWELSLYF